MPGKYLLCSGYNRVGALKTIKMEAERGVVLKLFVKEISLRINNSSARQKISTIRELQIEGEGK